MKIQLWHNESVNQWRWVLTTDENPMSQESGCRENLYQAMEDIAKTVEHLSK